LTFLVGGGDSRGGEYVFIARQQKGRNIEKKKKKSEARCYGEREKSLLSAPKGLLRKKSATPARG